jgi:hypothetical protein
MRFLNPTNHFSKKSINEDDGHANKPIQRSANDKTTAPIAPQVGASAFATRHNSSMFAQRIGIFFLATGLLVLAHRQYGWLGVAAVAGGLVMWLLLHVTRLLTVMQRAARRPLGYVDSAVMLNAKLNTGDTLFRVVALTRSLGERHSPDNEQPEHFRWTDNAGSRVDAVFLQGRLQSWSLHRPTQ